MWPVPGSRSHTMTLDEVIARLSEHEVVDGLMLVGSAGGATFMAASDYDLVVVLSDMPAPLQVGLTTIDGRLADLLFVTVEQVEQILDLAQPVDAEDWIGRIVRWLQGGQVVFDRAGRLGRAQQQVMMRTWLRVPDASYRSGAWFGLNYNLLQTRRLCASDDPVYAMAADLRMAVYGTADLLFGYFRVRELRWEGDKAAVRYLRAYDPAYLDLLMQFIGATDRTHKLRLYETLAALATAPAGGLWPEAATAMMFEPGTDVEPDTVEQALAFWDGLLGG